MRQKRVPLGRKSFPKRGCLAGYKRNPKIISSQNCIDFDTKTYRFGHISGPSYKGAHAGWPAGWLVGWLAGWLGHQNASKTRTLREKVRQKHVPLGRKSFPKRGCLAGYTRNPKITLSQNCIDFDTKTYRFGHISGPSYRGAHVGWPAGWLVRRMPAVRLGHNNPSKTRTLSTKMRQKSVPLSRYSFPKRGCLVGYGRNP